MRILGESGGGQRTANFKPHTCHHLAHTYILHQHFTCATTSCTSFHTALAAGFFFVSIIIYSIGYCKLTGAVGYRNKTVRKLGLLTRNIAICLTFAILTSLACEYTFVGNRYCHETYIHAWCNPRVI